MKTECLHCGKEIEITADTTTNFNNHYCDCECADNFEHDESEDFLSASTMGTERTMARQKGWIQ
jgi:hypothetical protein